MKNKNFSNQNGITLVILVITMIIILILVGIGTGTYVSYIKMSKASKAEAELQEISQAVGERYMTYLTTKDRELLTGTMCTKSEMQEISNKLNITLQYEEIEEEVSTEKSPEKYYKLNKADLNNLNIRIKSDDEYIVNYKTREVINVTKFNSISDFTKINVSQIYYSPNNNAVNIKKDEDVEDSEDISIAGYQKVEYIESTGTQYIDTGIGSSSIGKNIRIELDFQLTEYINNTWICGTQELECGIFNGFHSHFIYSQTSDYLARTTAVGTKVKTSSYKIMLFARDWNGTTTEYRPAKVKIYSTKIYIDDKIVRDFIPYYRKSDGEIGMYDVVNNKFYTNLGTGSFIKGANV